jgi:hypothetical protein
VTSDGLTTFIEKKLGMQKTKMNIFYSLYMNMLITAVLFRGKAPSVQKRL